MGRYINIVNDIVTAIRIGEVIVEGEVESDSGELGQIRQADGTFVDPALVASTPVIAIETRLESIENTLDILLLKQEGII